LGAERIGHGLASFRDPKLVETLVRDSITLEVCPTSNRRTGALRVHTGGDDLAAHPLVGYVRAAVPVTINTDDPGLFSTDLNTEYALAHRLGLAREELTQAARRGFEAAFCDDPTRAALLACFDASAEVTGKT
jgi:aminodeoxyfutalosine deaminase